MMLGWRSRATASASIAEAGEVVGPRLAAAADHLQGDQPVQPALPGLVDDPHASFAQPLENVVAGDGRPVRGSRLPFGLSCLRIGSGSRARPVGVVRFDLFTSIEFLRAAGLARLGSGGAVPRRFRAPVLIRARDGLTGVGRRGLALVARGLVSTVITGDDLGRGKTRRLLGVGSHRLDRRSFSRRGATPGQALKLFLTDDAVLNVRQDAGIVVGVELPVEKLQQDAVAGTCIHDGIPRMAAPARPGVASMWFT